MIEDIFTSEHYKNAGPNIKAFMEYSMGMLNSFDLKGSVYEESLKEPPMITAAFMQGLRDGEYWNAFYRGLPEWDSYTIRIMFAFEQGKKWMWWPYFILSDADFKSWEESYNTVMNNSKEKQNSLKAFQDNPEALDQLLKDILKNDKD